MEYREETGKQEEDRVTAEREQQPAVVPARVWVGDAAGRCTAAARNWEMLIL